MDQSPFLDQPLRPLDQVQAERAAQDARWEAAKARVLRAQLVAIMRSRLQVHADEIRASHRHERTAPGAIGNAASAELDAEERIAEERAQALGRIKDDLRARIDGAYQRLEDATEPREFDEIAATLKDAADNCAALAIAIREGE